MPNQRGIYTADKNAVKLVVFNWKKNLKFSETPRLPQLYTVKVAFKLVTFEQLFLHFLNALADIFMSSTRWKKV